MAFLPFRARKQAKGSDGAPVATRHEDSMASANAVPEPNGNAVQPTARDKAVQGHDDGTHTTAAAPSDANGSNGVVRTAEAAGAVPASAAASSAVGGKRKALVMAKHKCRGMCMEEGYACIECWQSSQEEDPELAALEADDTGDGHNNGSADDKEQFYETDSGTDDGDEGEAPPVSLLRDGQWHAMKLADLRSYMRAAALRFARGENDPQREGTSQITTAVTAN